MQKLNLISAFIIALLSLISPSHAFEVSDFKNKNPVLLVYTDDLAAIPFLQQRTEHSTNIDGIFERNIVRFNINMSEQTIIPYYPKQTSDLSQTDLPEFNEIEKLNPESLPFRLILIGKDGTLLKDSDQPVKAEELFSIIDSTQ